MWKSAFRRPAESVVKRMSALGELGRPHLARMIDPASKRLHTTGVGVETDDPRSLAECDCDR